MYCEITNGKIMQRIRKGGSYKHISFGDLAEDQEYFDAGLYKLVEEVPQLAEGFALGEPLVIIEEDSKTVTSTYEIVELSLEEKYKQGLKKINSEYEKAIIALTTDVPPSEQMTWYKQEIEARVYSNDKTVATPLIDSIVASRGVTKDYLVAKIIAKADAYTAAVGELTGIRQAKEDLLVKPS